MAAIVWPINRGDVEAHLGVTPAADRDIAYLDTVTAAVVTLVERWTDEPRGADVVTGALMLAGRLYARRQSPLGVAAFGDMGTAYVRNHDPDIYRLLGLGRPRVG